MTAPVEELAPATTGDDDVVHWVCCADEDLRLCGEVVPPGEDFVDDDVPVTCEPCLAVEDRCTDEVDLCPVYALRLLKGTA